MRPYSIRRTRTLRDRAGNLSAVASFIILSVIVFLFVYISLFFDERVFTYLALKPSSIARGESLWTLASHMFVHGGLGHLVLNMLVLFSLGTLAERIIGRKRFILLYISAGILAGLSSVVFSLLFGTTSIGERIFGGPDVYMVGASGAIFALAGLYVVLLPHIRFMIIFLPFFSLPAWLMVPLTLIFMWVISILGNWPIGNVAHASGFLVGMVYGFYLRFSYHKKVLLLRRMIR